MLISPSHILPMEPVEHVNIYQTYTSGGTGGTCLSLPAIHNRWNMWICLISPSHKQAVEQVELANQPVEQVQLANLSQPHIRLFTPTFWRFFDFFHAQFFSFTTSFEQFFCFFTDIKFVFTSTFFEFFTGKIIFSRALFEIADFQKLTSLNPPRSSPLTLFCMRKSSLKWGIWGWCGARLLQDLFIYRIRTVRQVSN